MEDDWNDPRFGSRAAVNRLAWLIDTQAYFTAAYQALLNARKSIFLVGWGFDPRTRLAPDGGTDLGEPDEIGKLILKLKEIRPELDVNILIWKSALPISATQDFFPHKARAWFEDTGINFHLDAAIPLGACHHQKLLIIDDAIAFTGGGDFGTDRWDSPAHRDTELRRRDPDRAFHRPRHEVMLLADGEVARQFSEIARSRWERATGETLAPPAPATTDPWPDFVKPDVTDSRTLVARTDPGWGEAERRGEILDQTLELIQRAKKTIYLENQYFTSPVLAEALAGRLAEPEGPEILLISTRIAPSWFDHVTMDLARGINIRRMREADIFGRFRAFSPVTSEGQPIIVHSKVLIIDDEVARVGSANLNNRSLGFDTELDLALTADDDADRASISRFRSRLISHFMARDADTFDRAVLDRGGLIRAIEHLNRHGRLAPIVPGKRNPFSRFVSAFHVGDPAAREDVFRLILRRKRLNEAVNMIAAEGGVRRFIASGQSQR